jgi:hypothetical protein
MKVNLIKQKLAGNVYKKCPFITNVILDQTNP